MWDLQTIKRMNEEAVAKATLRRQHAEIVEVAKRWAEAYSRFYRRGGSSYGNLFHQEEALALAVGNLRKEEEIATS